MLVNAVECPVTKETDAGVGHAPGGGVSGGGEFEFLNHTAQHTSEIGDRGSPILALARRVAVTVVGAALLTVGLVLLILPGPGNSLGGVCAQVLIAEGWRGLRSRADFEALQAGPAAPLHSMRR